jgi:hypothetical protein
VPTVVAITSPEDIKTSKYVSRSHSGSPGRGRLPILSSTTQYNVYLLSHLLFRADIFPVSLADSRKDRVDMDQSSPSCSEFEARTNNQIAEQQSSVCEHTLAAKPESTRDALETRPSVIPAGISPSTQKQPRPWQPSVGVRSGTKITSSGLSKTFTTIAFPSVLARGHAQGFDSRFV